MLNSKEKRFVNRLEDLICKGKEIAKTEKFNYGVQYFNNNDLISLNAWLTKVRNIIRNIFKIESEQYKQLQELISTDRYQIYAIVGLLNGAKDDIKDGFLIKQEFIIAGEVFDSLLEQAQYLNNKGHKDPAAVMARVVLEDVLKRIAREEKINSQQKASSLNNELKKIERYPPVTMETYTSMARYWK